MANYGKPKKMNAGPNSHGHKHKYGAGDVHRGKVDTELEELLPGIKKARLKKESTHGQPTKSEKKTIDRLESIHMKEKHHTTLQKINDFGSPGWFAKQKNDRKYARKNAADTAKLQKDIDANPVTKWQNENRAKRKAYDNNSEK